MLSAPTSKLWHCLGGRWGQSGVVLGNGGRSAPEAWVVSRQAQRLGEYHLPPWRFPEAALCRVLCLSYAFVIPYLQTLAGAMPSSPLLILSPSILLDCRPRSKAPSSKMPSPPCTPWSSAGCGCCCWKAVDALTANLHCSPARFQTLEEGPSVGPSDGSAHNHCFLWSERTLAR